MAMDIVDVGTSPNAGDGDPLRSAFIKVNTRLQQIAALLNNRGAWTTATVYSAASRDWVVHAGQAYIAAIDHTSGVFADDLAAGRWFAADVAQLSMDLAAVGPTKGSRLIGFEQAGVGAMPRVLEEKLRDTVSVKDFGAECDWNGTSGTDDTAAFQAVCNAVPVGEVWDVLVPASAKVAGVVTAGGGGAIAWHFAQGAKVTGGGTLPFQKATMAYNSSPNFGARRSIWHGTDAKPATDGVVATDYIQRVDQSVTSDDPGHLISAQYVTHKRLTGGTGWLYSHYSYLEDQSNSGAAQSVAVAGAAHTTVSADVWGIYGEANSHSPFGTITGGEFDAINHSGADYPYHASNPVDPPPNGNFSCGVWALSAGGKKNSFAIGLGTSNSSQTTTSSWGCGIYMQTWSCTEYGIDIQAQPKTLIHFKYGASTDGSGVTAGGIGLDCGATAAYGTGPDQGAIHLRQQRLCFGAGGYMVVNGSLLEFWSAGARRGYIDLGGTDHAL